MDKTFIGNGEAFRQLENYLQMEHPGPMILHGPKGTGKRLAAYGVCAQLLECGIDALDAQPDFFLLDKGTEAVKVEDVLAVIQKSCIAAVKNRKVFLILGADRMNEQAQNKLLKLLEDRNSTNTVILVCDENSLLPTIQSRCITVGFQKLPKQEMEEYLKTQDIHGDDLRLFEFLCGGCPYRADEIKECFKSLKDLYRQIIAVRDRRELLGILHLTKEKDPEEFFSAQANHFDYALTMLLYVFTELLEERALKKKDLPEHDTNQLSNLYSPLEAYEISAKICVHRSMFKGGYYTKNDFFDLARTII